MADDKPFGVAHARLKARRTQSGGRGADDHVRARDAVGAGQKGDLHLLLFGEIFLNKISSFSCCFNGADDANGTGVGERRERQAPAGATCVHHHFADLALGLRVEVANDDVMAHQGAAGCPPRADDTPSEKADGPDLLHATPPLHVRRRVSAEFVVATRPAFSSASSA